VRNPLWGSWFFNWGLRERLVGPIVRRRGLEDLRAGLWLLFLFNCWQFFLALGMGIPEVSAIT